MTPLSITPEVFLGSLRARGVQVSMPGDGRLIFFPKGSLTPEELSTAKDLKQGLLDILATEGPTYPEPDPTGLVPVALPGSGLGSPLTDPDRMYERWLTRIRPIARSTS